MKRVPTCNLVRWNTPAVGRDGLKMRPGGVTVAYRLAWSGVLLMAAFGVYFVAGAAVERIDTATTHSSGFPSGPGSAISPETVERVRETLSPEAVEVLESAQRTRQEDAKRLPEQPASRRKVVRFFWMSMRTAGAIALGACAFFSLISVAFGQLRVATDPMGNLDLYFWNYLPVSRSWPSNSFDTLRLFVARDARRSRSGREVWTWMAQPQNGDTPSFPHLASISLASDTVGPIFLLARQHHAPDPDPPIPDRVYEFAAAFNAATGISHEERATVGSGWSVPSFGKGSLGRTFTLSVGSPQVSTTTFSSLEELPEDMRSEVAELIDRADRDEDGIYVSKRQRITVVDESGERRVYKSVDEMPPELRARFRDLM